MLTACVVAGAFGAAVFSYRFVEQPLRQSSKAPGPLLIRYGVVGFALLATCALIWLSQGVARRYPDLAQMEAPGLALTMIIHVWLDMVRTSQTYRQLVIK